MRALYTIGPVQQQWISNGPEGSEGLSDSGFQGQPETGS